jgi:hypothetical protein
MAQAHRVVAVNEDAPVGALMVHGSSGASEIRIRERIWIAFVVSKAQRQQRQCASLYLHYRVAIAFIPVRGCSESKNIFRMKRVLPVSNKGELHAQ